MKSGPSIKVVLQTYWIVLLAPFLLLGPLLVKGQVLFWGTPGLQFVPWWDYAYQSLRQGSLPLWNPLNGMGAPLLANYQTAFFYPLNLILLLFAAVGGPRNSASAIALGYTLLAALHLSWGGLGMALLVRRLGFRWLGQVVAGLAFGLSGYITARLGFFSMVWVAAWLPWVILFADHLSNPDVDGQNNIHGIKVRLHLGLLLSFAMQLLAGHAQLTWYSMLLAFAWVTVGALRCGGRRTLISAWLSLGLAALLAAGLAAVQLVPTFEYLRLSHRADAVAFEEAMTYSFWPWRLLTMFAPDFFGNPARGDFWGYASYWEDHLYLGMLPILLACSTLWLLVKGFWRKQRPAEWGMILFLWIGILVTFLLAFGRNTPLFPFLYQYVPTFDMFQAPARYLIWAAFAFSLLAAVAIEHWRCPTGRGLYWFRLGTAGAFAVTLGAAITWITMRNVQATFIRSAALAGFWALGFGLLTLIIPWSQKRGRTGLWQAVVIVWALMDILLSGWSLNPGVPLSFYQKMSAAGSVLSGQRVYLPRREEYDLKFRRFLRFDDFTELEDWRNMRTVLLPELNLLDQVALISNFDPLVPDTYMRWIVALDRQSPEVQKSWLAWMGVGAVEHIDVRQPVGVRFDLLEGSSQWHWYSCARLVREADEIWQEMRKELLNPVTSDRLLIVEDPTSEGTSNCVPNQQARVARITERPDSIEIVLTAGSSGWLEVVSTWYPGWRATINGLPVRLFKADGAFMAVPVGSGTSTIRFEYRPQGFYFSGLFSILVLLSILLFRQKMGRGYSFPSLYKRDK